MKFVLLAGCCLFAASVAHAQEAPRDDDDIVVTAQADNQTQVIRGGQVGVLGDKAGEDVPFSIRAYGETLILNQQPLTLGQVLENDPSVRASYGFGNAAELFVIRGFPLFGDDIGLDGLYGMAPRQLISPELYEQVQILNGASAFLNGAAPGGTGIGGSVNLTLKRAGDRPLTRVTGNFSEGAHFGGAVDVSRRFGAGGEFGVRINGAYRAGDVSVNDEFRRSAVIGAGFDWRGERARLSLDLAYQRLEVRGLRPKVTVIGLTSIPEVPRADANYAQPWTYTELRDVFGLVKGEYDLADNALLYASFGARDGSEDGIYSGLTVTDAVTGAARGDALFVPRTDNNEAAQAGLRLKLAAGGVSHEINFGGSMSWQVNRNAFDFLSGFATNLYDTPVVPQPGTGFVGGDLDDPFAVSRVRLGSAFVSDTLGFFDDRVLLTAGLRLQAINVRGYSYTGGSLASEYAEDAVTPVVGLVVKPVEGLSLFANRIEGLAQGPTAPTTDPLIVNPGEVFAPFTSAQYEVGGKLTFGRFNAGAAVFQIAQPSAFARPINAADPTGPRIFAVEGVQRHRGVELTLDGELVDGLRFIGGASVIQAKLRDTEGGTLDGNTAVGVPDYTINANVEWDTPFIPGFTLTGRVIDTGKQQVDRANTLEIPGWTRFDLGARYVVAAAQRPLTLRLNVDNVANERYWQSAFDSFSPSLLQGMPRTVKLSASVEL
ncbi:TonB-dependent receptor [Sphingomonas qomolangmaensis]|uniref:TonB-dependent receptor n=1 Tax=Sphingomonas qomolangmaensis TaxID=2918765 RepID=A0ABY5L9K3_9SPHN|nr:TonB-dependent receptor [Sphingomonas qomolangmaensis]UUL82836.1 TonB-dependent receptor [Sphingomonas qomolangmaensis]